MSSSERVLRSGSAPSRGSSAPATSAAPLRQILRSRSGPRSDTIALEAAARRDVPRAVRAVAPTELRAEMAQAYRIAEMRGYAEGAAQAAEDLAARVRAAGTMAERLEALAPREASHVATAIAHLAVAIARRVVAAELRLDPEALVRALEEAVLAANGSPDARVLLHPDTLDAVRTAWEEAHGTKYLGKRWTFEADATLPAGGCQLRFEHGFVDASLETHLDEIATAIEHALPGIYRDAIRGPEIDGE
jgi:flagellar biosynthesis/type III secretory pathway protein FliH